MAELTDRETLVLIGDGRSDSPGHSAKYGCYTVIEQGIQKVLDIQIVQVSYYSTVFVALNIF